MASIEIHPEDYLDEISTETLVREIKDRARHGDRKCTEADLRMYAEILEDIEVCVRRGDIVAALLEIDKARYLAPGEIKDRYAKAMQSRHPETGRPVIQ